MATVEERLRKRNLYPIELGDEVVHARAPRKSERERMMKYAGDEVSYGILFGYCLLNDDRSPVFTPNAEEGDEDFGSRVLNELDLPDDTRVRLATAILKLATAPPDLAKN